MESEDVSHLMISDASYISIASDDAPMVPAYNFGHSGRGSVADSPVSSTAGSVPSQEVETSVAGDNDSSEFESDPESEASDNSE